MDRVVHACRCQCDHGSERGRYVAAELSRCRDAGYSGIRDPFIGQVTDIVGQQQWDTLGGEEEGKLACLLDMGGEGSGETGGYITNLTKKYLVAAWRVRGIGMERVRPDAV